MIVRSGQRQNPWQPQHVPGMVHHRGSGFERIPLRPEAPQKGEPDIRVVQKVAFQKTADPDRNSRCLELNQVQPEAVFLITGNRPIAYIHDGIGLAPDTPVSDILQKRRFVEHFEDELRVIPGEMAKA